MLVGHLDYCMAVCVLNRKFETYYVLLNRKLACLSKEVSRSVSTIKLSNQSQNAVVS